MRRLRVKRVLVGFSQAELAKRVGKSSAWLSLVERGYLRPSPEMFRRLQAALKGGEESDGRG